MKTLSVQETPQSRPVTPRKPITSSLDEETHRAASNRSLLCPGALRTIYFRRKSYPLLRTSSPKVLTPRLASGVVLERSDIFVQRFDMLAR
jgi:hypothetical protein